MSRTYDSSVPSDGLTIDTDRGPVDTVALDRVRRGIYTPLQFAEDQHLNAGLLTYDGAAEGVLAEGLGISRSGVNRRVVRARQRAGIADTQRSRP